MNRLLSVVCISMVLLAPVNTAGSTSTFGSTSTLVAGQFGQWLGPGNYRSQNCDGESQWQYQDYWTSEWMWWANNCHSNDSGNANDAQNAWITGMWNTATYLLGTYLGDALAGAIGGALAGYVGGVWWGLIIGGASGWLGETLANNIAVY